MNILEVDGQKGGLVTTEAIKRIEAILKTPYEELSELTELVENEAEDADE